ncbi:MAG TPA: hypothetical protein VE135_29205 [Pyrinomonadaceae bacterium]|nr:hypothetical protein [Pyrinomonadaceae bacterium]
MRYLLILLLGLIIGAGATAFLLGMPRAKATPGTVVKAPEPSGDPSGTVVVSVSNSFFELLLGSMFRDLGPPALRLGRSGATNDGPGFETVSLQQGCTNMITLAPEGSNVKTQVQFANGKISVPLAFSGNYNLLGNCIQFKGWAQTTIQLRFEQEKQTVYGQVNVEAVTLEGVNPAANNFVTVFVRDAINEKVNPLELIRAPQLQLMVPVKASNGAIKARVKDVRAEVLDGSLNLHITYEFSGERNAAAAG